jgi:hypothetical protein
MKNKVVPFPASNSLSIPPESGEGSHRVLVRIGNQRIALDLKWRATVLAPTAQPTATPSDGLNQKRGKERAR